MDETLVTAGIYSAYWEGKDYTILKFEVRLYSFTTPEQGYIVIALTSELRCDADLGKTAQRVSKHESEPSD